MMADYGRIDDNSCPEQHINYSQQSPGCILNNNTAQLQLVTHQHFANCGQEPKKLTTLSSSHVTKQQNQSAAHKHFDKKSLSSKASKAKAIDLTKCNQALTIRQQILLLDDEDDQDNDAEFGDKDGTELVCLESCPPSLYPVGSPSGVGHDYAAMTPEDTMVLEVGHGTFEYLEECFFTEVLVLDREQFNAIPEIVKAGFTIMMSGL